jgi:hypothetical protein
MYECEISTYRSTLIDKCQISLVPNINYSSKREIRMVCIKFLLHTIDFCHHFIWKHSSNGRFFLKMKCAHIFKLKAW